MAERKKTSRQTAKRQPLGELRNCSNAPTPPAQRADNATKSTKLSSVSPLYLPHNESLEPNGSLAVRNSSQQHTPEPYKRVSQLVCDEKTSKRSSATSNASTDASGTRKLKGFIGHWQLGKTIGKGGCSRVRVVRHRYRDLYGAVKIITRATAESTRAQSLANLVESTAIGPSGHKPIPFSLVREIAIMKLLEHPNIVRLYDVWENHNELYLIMEYVDGGELFHYVDERKGLPEEESVYIFRQIVAALLYCHRMLICHRDLKPENILLNQRDLTVKLIDFGMAALQPAGKLLSTPCGSPHYAAPEVISSNPYDGTQADVWSCGVILYVMLTGMTPYNYDAKGDIRTLFRDIARAHYYVPKCLTSEAKDLIQHIFVPNPKARITMDGVWDHRLMHKYDKVFGFDRPGHTKDHAIGEVPKLECWRVKRIQDIDREILRNMRTLWHSEPEQALIQKLLNKEHNQEKLFYAALLKHREENQENYIGDPKEMGYSASDYHHNKPSSSRGQASSTVLRTMNTPRSSSQYSIMNNEHLNPGCSSVKPAPSVASYDPYRASKSPIVESAADCSVTVHRNHSSKSKSTAATRKLRHPNSMRIEMLKQQNRRSNYSNSSLARSAGRSRRSALRSSASYSSMNGSPWASSPPVIATMRPSDLHKRGVSFGHLRKTSTASWLTTQASIRPRTPTMSNIVKSEASSPEKATPSPPGMASAQVTSKKGKLGGTGTPGLHVRPLAAPSITMRSEIRKHSAELEKACEEAFFRSSVGSSFTPNSSLTDKPSPYDTPPSSLSTAPFDRAASKGSTRPLPVPPQETPNTYLTRTLEETRDKLAAYRGNPNDNTARFDEVMRMLENIMPHAGPWPSERRSMTVPESKLPENQSFLPAISEEVDQSYGKERASNWHRSVTAPVRQDRKPEDQTIRMVAPSSPGATPAPLKIRKRPSTGQMADEKRLNLVAKASHDTLSRKKTNDAPVQAKAAESNGSTDVAPVVRKKRSGWFGLGRKDAEPVVYQPIPGIPTDWLRFDDRLDPKRKLDGNEASAKAKPLPLEPSASPASSEFPMRKKQAAGEKRGFSKWLSSKRAGKSEPQAVQTSDANVETVQSLDSLFSSDSPTPSGIDPPSSVGPERSWFARFFHLKPAVKVLCFTIPRGRARQELVLLLKQWQVHGIRDLQWSRRTNIITAQVDRNNKLDIKPVSFRIELFVVLEHGRRVGLSIARFVQVKGAASGFRRVLEVINSVMHDRGWLVEEEEKWRALCEVVDG